MTIITPEGKSGILNKNISKPKMLGVTIATPGYLDLAKEAARRYRLHSGGDTIILESDKAGFETKFKLVDIFKGQQICFFDADCFAVRELDLSEFIGKPGVYGVNDPTWASSAANAFVRHDSIVLGIEFKRYLNTGFLILNFADETVVKAFEDAKLNIYNKQQLGVNDKTEQSILNYGFRHTLINILPFKYNFFKPAVDWGCYPHIPRDIINVHAAGYQPLSKKMEELKKQCAVFGGNVNNMRDATTYGESAKRGFIITTKDQEEMAKEAKTRAFKYASIDCRIVLANSKEHAHQLKLETFLEYNNEEVYLIDNDLWFVDKIELPEVKSGEIVATRSINKTIEQRCERYSMEYERYFCSCFVGAFVDVRFKEVIKTALLHRSCSTTSYKDEVFFNIAAQSDDYKLITQPTTFNWCANNNLSKEVKAIHAAGKKVLNKIEWLKEGLDNYEKL